MSTVTETDQLRQEIRMLTERVEEVERHVGLDGIAPMPPVDLTNILPAVRQITQDLFPGKFELTEECDQEYPDDRYTVVSVEAIGDLHEIAQRGCTWHQRIRELSPDMRGALRLSIAPR